MKKNLITIFLVLIDLSIMSGLCFLICKFHPSTIIWIFSPFWGAALFCILCILIGLIYTGIVLIVQLLVYGIKKRFSHENKDRIDS